MRHVVRGSARFPVAFALMATALGLSGQSCAVDPGPRTVPSRDVGGEGRNTSSGDAGAADVADAESSLDAATSSGDGASSPGEPSDAGPPEATPDGSAASVPPLGDGGTVPVWATWPMPNAPSSGLPRPQSYDTTIEGTALDEVTGLMWQRGATIVSADDEDSETVLADVNGTCTALDLGGFHDWRVPTRIEFVSLIDFTAFPAENVAVFTAPEAFFIASSQRSAASGANIGMIWLGDGTANTAGAGVHDNTVAFTDPVQGPDAVRCVRGGMGGTGPHYTVAGGTVRDNWTGLTWQRDPSASSMEPSSVISYCAGQTMAGGGWRAPSANEAETLWGDFDNPPSVGVDAIAFPNGTGGGTSNVYVSSTGTSNPKEWIDVGGQASTGMQADVPASLFTISGMEPYYEYWYHAQCVR